MGDRRMTRRDALGLLGAAGAAAVAAACSSNSSKAGNSTSTTATSLPGRPTTTMTSVTDGVTAAPACVLTPEMTEGPFYIAKEAVRSDITEGKPGTPLHLVLTVVDAGSCQPLSGAAVDIWHADATGEYSGFGAASSNRTFLRGLQVAGADGKVDFRTIYPGWYQGRVEHIHVKVHTGGSVVHTGQLFFDPAVSDAVYSAAPYNTHTGQRTTNAQDGIYRIGGSHSTLKLAKEGDGYLGTLTMGVQSQAAASQT
ncbi:MAG TPA: intradiol ring-cleavage dioxygenase [Acidimicrobiales bacterium]|nr:intradiol ring-cleavage dioxygenase [Acidimicrobiales bacterium]